MKPPRLLYLQEKIKVKVLRFHILSIREEKDVGCQDSKLVSSPWMDSAIIEVVKS